MWPDRKTWENVRQESRDGWIDSIEVYLIEAALAAADAWDRERGVVRVRAIHDGTPGPDEPREPRPVPR